MRRLKSIIAALGLMMMATSATAQREGFINVDGPNLAARIDAATRQNANRGRYWIAYAFDVRAGLCIDNDWNGGVISRDGTPCETRNVGLFALREPGTNSIVRVEVYNLDRRRQYSGYPVYWLGRANSNESLDFLKSLTAQDQDRRAAEHSVMAIAFHDDARVDSILEDLIRSSSNRDTRKTAVFWLGQTPGHHPFLGELVRNEQEDVEVRKQAAFAIGVSRDRAAMSQLESLYPDVRSREVKKQIIFAASINHSESDGVDFLIRTAESDQDRELKKQALFWLGQKAGKRALEALGKTVESNDAETEVQKQAVFAISQRPKDEAVPLLIKIARTHSKPEVRKQAIFWLGQTGDERALEFFKEILK
ncbi:MAG: HEAT repeat domain-containing protein [Acidobacteriota bacterium]